MKIKKNKFLLILLSFWLLGLVYLALPEPVIPNLPNSLKSDEPGDTVSFFPLIFFKNPFNNLPA